MMLVSTRADTADSGATRESVNPAAAQIDLVNCARATIRGNFRIWHFCD
jgi:hypothetical protein